MTGRVALVLIALGYGGAEVQVVELASHLKGLGWDPLLIGLSKPQGLEVRADELSIPHTHLDLPFQSRSPLLVPRLARAVRAFGPAVMHTHTLPPNFIGRLAYPTTRAPVLITSAHNVFEGGRRKMAFYRATDRIATMTTNCSDEAVRRYIEIRGVPSPQRIRLMPNGIDLHRFRPVASVRERLRGELGLAPDEFFWIAVGAHSDQKDYPNLLAAAQHLAQRTDQPYRICVVGDGPLLDTTRAEVHQRGLADRVHVMGRRTDVHDLMRAADGYVMSSAWEGLPIVLLEAAASALPIVATDVGGNASVVLPGTSGHLVPSQDPTALADRLLRVMQLAPSERVALGVAGRSHVAEHYSLPAMALRWDALYRELLQRRGAGHLAPPEAVAAT